MFLQIQICANYNIYLLLLKSIEPNQLEQFHIFLKDKINKNKKKKFLILFKI